MLQDQIKSFIRSVTLYLMCQDQEREAYELTMQDVEGAISIADLNDRIAEKVIKIGCKKDTVARQIRCNGDKLARALVEAGHNPTGVLRVAHCAGGGPDKLARIWGEVKAGLQRIAIQSECNAKTSDAKPKRRGRLKGTTTYNPKKDQQVAAAWATGQHKDYKSLAKALDISKRDVGLALDRHRKR